MAILGSAIKIKDDIVACISVMKNYDDRNKRKLFIGDATRSIFVKIKFMNSEDKRFVVVSDNITDEILADVKQSIEDYKNGRDRAIGFLVGQIMKASKGQANPQMINKMLLEEIAKR